MLIHVDVCGFYDWAPAPAGTEITERDVKDRRVKQMADGSWHVRVERKQDSTHDLNHPERELCERMAALEYLGHEPAREECVAEVIREVSLRHHLARRHMHEITVHDDGPNEALYRHALAAVGMHEDHVEAAVERYMAGLAGEELAKYLNVVFKTKPRK